MEIISQEQQAEQNQLDQQAQEIEASLAESMLVRNMMGERRVKACLKIQSEDRKLALCTKIQEEKRRLGPLAARIDILKDADKEIYDYIQRLEWLSGSIWCDTCDVAMTIHVPGRGAVAMDRPITILPHVFDQLTSANLLE